jgi:hypothetical protein
MLKKGTVWFLLIAFILISCPDEDGGKKKAGGYPEGYPKTMEMANPLFWQFESEQVNLAGTLAPGKSPLYTADASARVWTVNGVETLFVYPSHDMVVAAGCDRMDRYHVFSTTDMKNWTDYGEIIKADDVPWHNGPFDGGSKFMWAPDCVYKDGLYYYYFPHPSQNTSGNDWGANWQIGIATSSDPAKDFTILSTWLTGLNNGAEHQIDPHVFIDDDGQAYFYNGGGGRCYGGKLKDNMIEIDGDMQEMVGLGDFHEATWVHQYNGKYYISYSDNGGGGQSNGDQLKYAMSDNPLGPWEGKGAYVYATGNGTIHGSIVQFKSKWYAFYHTDYVSYVGNDQGRSVHVDELEYNDDGTIKLVKSFGKPYQNAVRTVVDTEANPGSIALTLQAVDFNEAPDGFNEIAGVNDGGRTYGYLSRHTKNGGTLVNNTYRKTVGMSIAAAADEYNITGLADREFTRYTINAEKGGMYQVDVYAASSKTASFFLATNGVNRSGTISVPNSGGIYSAINVENIPLRAGENLFEFRVISGGFDISRFEFKTATPYQGMPYKGTAHAVPGTRLEAEDFDLGGLGVAYFDTSGRNNGFYNYRSDNPANTNDPVVDLERDNSGRINICWTSTGEWVKYTLNVTQAGTYKVTANLASGNSNPGSIYLTFNDIDQYPPMSVTTSAWSSFKTVDVEGVKLEEGINIMTMTIGGNVNVDWYEFTRTGN